MTMPADESAGAPALPGSRALYDDAPCGLMLTSADGLIQRVNATMCRWVARSASVTASALVMAWVLVSRSTLP